MKQLIARKPELQPFLEMMQSNQLEQTQIAESEKALRKQNQKLMGALRKSHKEVLRLGKVITHLESMTRFYFEINDDLAAALGACPECWGSKKDCHNCHGNGNPGTFALDQEAFAVLVQPALLTKQGAGQTGQNIFSPTTN